jgi:hypothetical protein
MFRKVAFKGCIQDSQDSQKNTHGISFITMSITRDSLEI